MEFLILMILIYLIYRLGKWLVKISGKVSQVEESAHEYSKRLLSGIEDIASNTSGERDPRSRLERLKDANKDLNEKQRVRRMIEDELDI